VPDGKAEAEENKSLARRMVEDVFNEGNVGVVDEIFAPDYTPGNLCPHGGRQGLEEIKRKVAALRAAFPDLRVEIEDQIVAGDWVATRCTAQGSHLGSLAGLPPTGRRFRVSGIFTIRTRSGAIVEDWYQVSAPEVARQLGVADASAALVLQNGTRGL